MNNEYNQLFNVYLSKRIKKTIIFNLILKICIKYNRILIENSKKQLKMISTKISSKGIKMII